jgi:hypothetical protein
MKSTNPKIQGQKWSGIQNPVPANRGNAKWLKARKKIRKSMFE